MGTTSRSVAVLALGTLLAGAFAGESASAAAGGGWVTARGNDARTGRATSETVITPGSIGALAPVWSASGSSVAGTEAIVSGSAVYTVTADGRLRRLEATNGDTVWTSPLAGTGETPTLDSGTVYTLAAATVRATDATTGKTRFTTPVEYFCGDSAGCYGGLGTANGKVVVGAGGFLHILDGSTGTILSTTDLGQGDFDSYGGGTPAIDANDAAWASYKFTATVPVPPSTANPLPSPKISGNGASTPLIVGGRVYVTSKSRGITSFVVGTGAKTNFLPGATGAHRPLSTDGTRLFDVTLDHGVKTLTAYSLATGAVLWTRPGAVTAPLEVNGMVVVGENYSGLAVYDAASGALLKRLDGTARGADPIVSGGRIYAGYSSVAVPPGSNPPLTALGV